MPLTPGQEELLLAAKEQSALDPGDTARTGAYRVLDALGYVMVIPERRRSRRAAAPGAKVVLLTPQGEQAVARATRPRRTGPNQNPGSPTGEPDFATG